MENLIGWAGPKDPPNLTPQSPQSPLRPPVLTQQASRPQQSGPGPLSRPQQSGPGPLSRPRPGPASRKTPVSVAPTGSRTPTGSHAPTGSHIAPTGSQNRTVADDLHPIAPKPGPMRIVAPIAPRSVQR